MRNEYVLRAEGEVVERQDKNPNLPTGDIEIKVTAVSVINTADTTPLIIADETDALEDTRLKYRYFDLRRPCLQKNLKLRHQVTMITRNYLSDHGFWKLKRRSYVNQLRKEPETTLSLAGSQREASMLCRSHRRFTSSC